MNCQKCEPTVKEASGMYEVTMNGEPSLSAPISLCETCLSKLRIKGFWVKEVDPVQQMEFGK